MTRRRSWAWCEQSIHTVARSLWTVNSRSSSAVKTLSIQHARDHCEISLTKAVESRSKNVFPKTKGNIRNCAAQGNHSLAELHGYRRAGTSGEQTVDKGVLRGSRRGWHRDSRELSVAAGRADMTTLRYSNGWMRTGKMKLTLRNYPARVTRELSRQKSPSEH